MNTIIRPGTEADVPVLLAFIRELAEYEHLTHEVAATEERLRATLFGQRYIIDFTLVHIEKSARLRSVWNIRPDEDLPRLITCYVL